MSEDMDGASSADVEEQRHIDAARRGDLPAEYALPCDLWGTATEQVNLEGFEVENG